MMSTSRASSRKRKLRTPSAPKCPDCLGTGYLPGPTVTRIDGQGRPHTYTQLIRCKCYRESMSAAPIDDYAKRAANDRD